MSEKKLVIGIPTFKRPHGLKKLLLAISKLEVPEEINIKVLVADNEGEDGSGLKMLEELHFDFPFPLRGIGVPVRGISQVRNQILEQVFEFEKSDYLVMVDDDETVEPRWVCELYNIHKTTSADVVGGAILPEFSQEPPKWTTQLPIFWRNVHPSGAINLIHGTGAVLLSRRFWDVYNKPKFDIEFGLTGGGDKEFFTRLKKFGVSFAYASQAISYEFYDSSRVTLEWAKNREYRIGSTDIRIMKKHGLSSTMAVKEVIKFFSAISYYSLRFCIFYFNENIRIYSLLKIFRQFGKINALFGKPYEEYKNVKGS